MKRAVLLNKFERVIILIPINASIYEFVPIMIPSRQCIEAPAAFSNPYLKNRKVNISETDQFN